MSIYSRSAWGFRDTVRTFSGPSTNHLHRTDLFRSVVFPGTDHRQTPTGNTGSATFALWKHITDDDGKLDLVGVFEVGVRPAILRFLLLRTVRVFQDENRRIAGLTPYAAALIFPEVSRRFLKTEQRRFEFFAR